VRELASWGCGTTMHVVRLIAPSIDGEDHTKDIDFTPNGIRARWQAGYADAKRMIKRAPGHASWIPRRVSSSTTAECSSRPGLRRASTDSPAARDDEARRRCRASSPSRPAGLLRSGKRDELAGQRGQELGHRRMNVHHPLQVRSRCFRVHAIEDRVDGLVAAGAEDGRAEDLARVAVDPRSS
jgi:hypothetical protein